MSPKLLAFAPCERLIIGAEGDNTATLVALLQGYTLTVEELAEGTAPKEGVSDESKQFALPLTWYIFALWENPQDSARYVQRFQLISALGKAIAHGESPIDFSSGKRFIRWNVKLTAFPLDGFGDYILYLHVKTNDGPFIEVASYPIPVQMNHE